MTNQTLEDELKAHFKTYSIIGEYATTKDDLESFDIYEIAHERADSDENVIYYNKAHELIKNTSSEKEAEAMQQIEDCGCLLYTSPSPRDS